MNIETVTAPPPIATRHAAGKYGQLIDALKAQKEGWLRVAFTEMPSLINDESRRVALRQVATRCGIQVDTCMDSEYIYIRRTATRPAPEDMVAR